MVTQDQWEQWGKALKLQLKMMKSIDIDNPGEEYHYTPEEKQFLDSVDWTGFPVEILIEARASIGHDIEE